jgi:hypothetical protein
MNEAFTMEHTRQFIDLRIQLRDVHLDDGVEDVIAWRFLANGEYLVVSAYKMQSLELP